MYRGHFTFSLRLSLFLPSRVITWRKYGSNFLYPVEKSDDAIAKALRRAEDRKLNLKHFRNNCKSVAMEKQRRGKSVCWKYFFNTVRDLMVSVWGWGQPVPQKLLHKKRDKQACCVGVENIQVTAIQQFFLAVFAQLFWPAICPI